MKLPSDALRELIDAERGQTPGGAKSRGWTRLMRDLEAGATGPAIGTVDSISQAEGAPTSIPVLRPAAHWGRWGVVGGLCVVLIVAAAARWASSGSPAVALQRIDVPHLSVTPVQPTMPPLPRRPPSVVPSAQPQPPATAPPQRAPKSAPAPTEPAVSDDPPASLMPGLEAEVRLIAQAQAARRGSHWDRALRLLMQHREEFPQGELAEDRRALQALVLCESGSVRSGREIADQLLREHEATSHGPSLRRACGLDPTPEKEAP